VTERPGGGGAPQRGAGGGSQPSLRPTEPATLVVAGLAAAAVAWLLISNFYQDLPPMIWPPVIIIAGLAAFEAGVARQLWVRIHQRGGMLARQPGRAAPDPAREPVEPLAVARYAVLAKASSVAGAIFAGFYAGFLPWLLIESGRVSDAGADIPPTVGGLIASALFIAAALWLERACRVPEQDDEGGTDPNHDTT
jgi:Protein of unknown function (DUF3180)